MCTDQMLFISLLSKHFPLVQGKRQASFNRFHTEKKQRLGWHTGFQYLMQEIPTSTVDQQLSEP